MCLDYYKTSSYVIPNLGNDNNEGILNANIISFITMNWLELLILVIMIFKIRNIKDELNIKNELIIIMGLWIFFSLGYFATLFNQLD